jgi:hypothetical protein
MCPSWTARPSVQLCAPSLIRLVARAEDYHGQYLKLTGFLLKGVSIAQERTTALSTSQRHREIQCIHSREGWTGWRQADFGGSCLPRIGAMISQ